VDDDVELRRLLAAGDVDGALAALLPVLRDWAVNLARGLREPRPDADDLAHDAFLRLRGSPAFRAADNPLGYAFRTVKNLVIDHARNTKRTVAVGDQHLPVVEIGTSAERLSAIARRANLDDAETCMLVRVVFEQLPVTAAQAACGGPLGAPYYVLDRIFDKLAAAFGVARRRS
jgi:DNA-directed RNA polymerase specialized sigma24 family protein